MKEPDDVQRLIRLKRYETPGEEYFERFTEDFKERQRSEMLQRSSRSILAERVSLWLEETPGSKWLVPTGAAAAVIGAGIFFTSTGSNENEVPASALAKAPEKSSVLPAFPESSEKVIQLQLPKRDKKTNSIPEGSPHTSESLLPASVRNSIREL